MESCSLQSLERVTVKTERIRVTVKTEMNRVRVETEPIECE